VVGLRWTAPPTRSWFRGRGPELTGPLVRPQLGIRFAARIAPSFGGALIQEQVELWSAFGPGGRYATPRQLVRPPASFGPWIALTFEQGAGAGAVDAVSTFGVRGGLALWFDLRRPAGKQAAFKVPKP
jgi:hypothetical protein